MLADSRPAVAARCAGHDASAAARCRTCGELLERPSSGAAPARVRRAARAPAFACGCCARRSAAIRRGRLQRRGSARRALPRVAAVRAHAARRPRARTRSIATSRRSAHGAAGAGRRRLRQDRGRRGCRGARAWAADCRPRSWRRPNCWPSSTRGTSSAGFAPLGVPVALLTGLACPRARAAARSKPWPAARSSSWSAPTRCSRSRSSSRSSAW